MKDSHGLSSYNIPLLRKPIKRRRIERPGKNSIINGLPQFIIVAGNNKWLKFLRLTMCHLLLKVIILHRILERIQRPKLYQRSQTISISLTLTLTVTLMCHLMVMSLQEF